MPRRIPNNALVSSLVNNALHGLCRASRTLGIIASGRKPRHGARAPTNRDVVQASRLLLQVQAVAEGLNNDCQRGYGIFGSGSPLASDATVADIGRILAATENLTAPEESGERVSA